MYTVLVTKCGERKRPLFRLCSFVRKFKRSFASGLKNILSVYKKRTTGRKVDWQ